MSFLNELEIGNLRVTGSITKVVAPAGGDDTRVSASGVGVMLVGPSKTLAVATGTAQKMLTIPKGFKVTKVIHVQGSVASDKTHTMTLGDASGSTTGPTGSTGDVDGWDTSVDAAGTAGTQVVGDGAYAASAANIGLEYTVEGSIYAVHTVTAGPATTGTHYVVAHGYFA